MDMACLKIKSIHTLDGLARDSSKERGLFAINLPRPFQGFSKMGRSSQGNIKCLMKAITKASTRTNCLTVKANFVGVME